MGGEQAAGVLATVKRDQPATAPRFRFRALLPDVVALVLLLAVVSTSRLEVTGDGGEYLLMAERIASGRGPAVSIEEARARGLYDARLVDRNGRQQMWHFWFFPLCVAPFVALATVLGRSPVLAFAGFNALLLWIAFLVLRRRTGTLAAALLCGSPIIWWIDKPQAEVFTFAILLIGCAALPSLSLAGLCFAAAATQNPPIGALTILLFLVAASRGQLSTRSIWIWVTAFLLIAAHPLYYWFEIGRLTPLVDGGDFRIPGLRTFVTPVIDLNVGLVPNAPILALLMVTALVTGFRTIHLRRQAVFVIAACLILLLAFAQAPNVNSGGTPGMSRYALWLIPFWALMLDLERRGMPRSQRTWAVVAVAASLAWSAIYFQPRLRENYLTPTPLSLYVWTRYPDFENPLPEIFAERLRHRDAVNTFAATPDCAKALLQSGEWPSPCTPAAGVPSTCAADGALCYANRHADGTYSFQPTSRRGGIRVSALFN